MFEKNEEAVMKTWNREKYPVPMVTIRCMTFNHEKYIEDAIVGFLSQVTTYPFIIYIHDDCSTDRTASIIKKYERKYPRIIRAVYESENQYSKGDKGRKRIRELSLKYCKYKYEAICEGDDYWIDPAKLQKQIDYMEHHDDCSLTFTCGKVFNMQTQKFGSLIDGGYFDKESKEFSMHDQEITLRNYYLLKFPPTASHIFRSDCIKNIEDEMSVCIAGDIRARLYAMTKGYAYYFHDVTCVYRINVPNSATTKWKQHNKKQNQEAANSYIGMISKIDELSDYNYSDSLWILKSRYIRSRIRNSSSIAVLFDPENRRAFDQAPFSERMRIILKIILPEQIINWIRKVK